MNNKYDLFIEKVDVKNEPFLELKQNTFLDFLKNTTVFKKTHKTKRKITREFSLPLKDKSDRIFTLRRKDNKGNFIYQYVLANRENSTRSFFEDNFIHMHKNGNFHQNIIPSDISFYQKAFNCNL